MSKLINFIKKHLALPKKSVYRVFFAENLTEIIEDPRCPSEWKGSGIYDKELYGNRYFSITVCARNPEKAKIIAREYELEQDKRLTDEFLRNNPELAKCNSEDYQQYLFGPDTELLNEVALLKDDVDLKVGEIIGDWKMDQENIGWNRNYKEPNIAEVLYTYYGRFRPATLQIINS